MELGETARLTWRELPRCGDQRDAEFERKKGVKKEPQFFAPKMEQPAANWEMCGLRPHALLPAVTGSGANAAT